MRNFISVDKYRELRNNEHQGAHLKSFLRNFISDKRYRKLDDRIMSTKVLILIYSKEIAMIINRNSELEKNMYAKLSQVDELISSNDVYALGLRLNALSSLCKALREDSAVKALTEALDKVIESGIIDSIDKNSLKHFMIGNAFYTASDFTGDDKYKNEAVKLAAGFKNFARNEAGYFKDADDKKCLCKAYSYEPFYMAYETKDGGKEQYNDVIGQYNAMNDELFADTKYSSDTTAKVKVLSVYAASLIDTMEVMDQMIYEIYRKMQDYFKASVKAVLETGRDYDDFDDFDEESELMFAYAVLKGCRMKALHTEKYEGIVLGVCDKVMAGEIFTDDDTDKNVVSKAASSDTSSSISSSKSSYKISSSSSSSSISSKSSSSISSSS